MKNMEMKNNYIKYVTSDNIIEFLKACKTFGADVVSVSCSENIYEVTYRHAYKILGGENEVGGLNEV